VIVPGPPCRFEKTANGLDQVGLSLGVSVDREDHCSPVRWQQRRQQSGEHGSTSAAQVDSQWDTEVRPRTYAPLTPDRKAPACRVYIRVTRRPHRTFIRVRPFANRRP
jgi:hypothetical protein